MRWIVCIYASRVVIRVRFLFIYRVFSIHFLLRNAGTIILTIRVQFPSFILFISFVWNNNKKARRLRSLTVGWQPSSLGVVCCRNPERAVATYKTLLHNIEMVWNVYNERLSRSILVSTEKCILIIALNTRSDGKIWNVINRRRFGNATFGVRHLDDKLLLVFGSCAYNYVYRKKPPAFCVIIFCNYLKKIEITIQCCRHCVGEKCPLK